MTGWIGRQSLAAWIVVAWGGSVGATTYVVTTTAASGPGSLAAAIAQANTDAAADSITFAILGDGPYTITPPTLPAIIHPVSLDGTTQPSYAGKPVVELSGAAAGLNAPGLVLSGHSGSTIRGIAFTAWDEPDGPAIRIEANGGGHVVDRCWFGVAPDGQTIVPNAIAIELLGSTSTIGGAPAARNVIVGGAVGVQSTSGSGNVIANNHIGVRSDGVTAQGNGVGIALGGTATGMTIGGAAGGNVITGNRVGVSVAGPAAANHLIAGNNIGLDAAGFGGIAGEQGIELVGAGGVVIRNNLIGQQSQAGVRLFGAASGVVVRGNSLGVDETGFASRRNGVGILVVGGDASPTNVDIGGPGSLDPNRIAYSVRDAISLVSGATSPSGVRIRHNTIFGSGGLGIDLGDDGVTANDPGDGDSGPNGRLNFPVLEYAWVPEIGSISVRGRYEGVPNLPLTLDIFATSGHPSQHGEGDFLLGSHDIVTDATGAAAFETTFAQDIGPGTQITATATNQLAGTSEFAANVITGECCPPPTTSTTTTTSTTSTAATAPTTSLVANTTTSTTTRSPATTTTTIPCATIDVEGVVCLLDALPPAACPDALPASIRKQIAAARKLAQRADTTSSARARRFLKRAAGKSTRAGKKVAGLARRRKVPAVCADELGAALAEVAARARAAAG